MLPGLQPSLLQTLASNPYTSHTRAARSVSRIAALRAVNPKGHLLCCRNLREWHSPLPCLSLLHR